MSTTVSATTITTATTWAAADGPFTLSGPVTIAAGGSLTIQSGVTVNSTDGTADTLVVATGGSLTATGVTFSNTKVIAQDGSTGSIATSTFGATTEFDATSITLSGDTFNANVTIDPSFIAQLTASNTFAGGTVINLQGQSTTGSLTFPAVPNVASYNLLAPVTVTSGASLTIASGVHMTATNSAADQLIIASNGNLSATGVIFFSAELVAQDGSTGSITGSTFDVSTEFDATSITLSGDIFNANPSVDPTFVPTLAGNNNHFASGTIVNLLTENISTSVTLPAITNVTSYQMVGPVTVITGGSLAVESGVTLGASSASVDTLTIDGGGSLSAVGATFDCQIVVTTGSTVLLEYNTFDAANCLTVDAGSTETITSNDFSAPADTVVATGTGGPINLEGNYWGVTTTSGIAAKVVDNADNPGLPVIDYSNFLISMPGIPSVIVFVQPASQSVSSGQVVTFSAAAAGSPTPSVQWQISTNGTTFTNINGATSSTYTFTVGSGQGGDEFRAVFTNGSGSATSNAATLSVAGTSAGSPVITEQPFGNYVFDGDDVTFTVDATGTPAPTIQWQVSTDGTNFTDIAGATLTTYTFAADSSQNGDLFRAVVSNSNGTAISDAAELDVFSDLPEFPEITQQPADQNVVVGQPVTFQAGAEASPTPTVQWQVSTNGTTFTNIVGATSSSYTFNAAAIQNGDQFRAVFRNSFGTVTSDPATLSVATPPSVHLATSNVNAGGAAGQIVTVVYAATDATINTSTISGANLTVRAPNNLVLNVSVFNVAVTGDNATVTYLVSPPNTVWQSADNGTCSVVVNAGSVKDSRGYGSDGSSTTFTVSANRSLVLAMTSTNVNNAVIAGQPATITATLSAGSSGSAAPTGTVTFFSDGTSIGSAPIGSGGSASLVVSTLPFGSHAISASYSGDSTHPSIVTGVPMLQSIVATLGITPVLLTTKPLPASVTVGKATTIKQMINLVNTSGVAFTGPLTVTTFLSTTTTLDTSAIQLQTLPQSLKLKAGSHKVLNVKLANIPAVPAGTYHLDVLVRDSNGNFSMVTSSQTMTFQPSSIDLAATSLTALAGSSTGKNTKAKITIANAGNVPATGPMSVNFYESTDSDFDSSDTLIGSLVKQINIKNGKVQTIPFSFQPTNITTGSNYLIAVINTTGTIVESNTANNTIASAGPLPFS